jgi:hypothetical protein
MKKILAALTTLLSGIAFASGQYVEIEDSGQVILNNYGKQKIIESVSKRPDKLFCDRSKLGDKPEVQEFLSEKLIEPINFVMEEPILTFAGIRKYSLRGVILRIEMAKFSELPEYQAQINEINKNIKYTVKNFFGSEVYSCTDFYFRSATVAFEKAAKTGKSVWKPSRPNEKFSIEGFTKKYQIDSSSMNYAMEDSVIEVDLRNYVQESDITGETTLVVDCISCNLISEGYQKKFNANLVKFTVKADFRLLKLQLQLRKGI